MREEMKPYRAVASLLAVALPSWRASGAAGGTIGRALARLGVRSRALAAAMLVVLAPATSAGADPGAIVFRATANPDRGARRATIGSCTMAVPPTRATVEAEIANAADFCELVSHALAGDVFRAPVIVTPGLLWHYADSTLSCRLRYGNTRYRLTIRNSKAACRWLRRLAPDWHLEPATTE